MSFCQWVRIWSCFDVSPQLETKLPPGWKNLWLCLRGGKISEDKLPKCVKPTGEFENLPAALHESLCHSLRPAAAVREPLDIEIHKTKAGIC